jgi:hypothetical protein
MSRICFVLRCYFGTIELLRKMPLLSSPYDWTRDEFETRLLVLDNHHPGSLGEEVRAGAPRYFGRLCSFR